MEKADNTLAFLLSIYELESRKSIRQRKKNICLEKQLGCLYSLGCPTSYGIGYIYDHAGSKTGFMLCNPSKCSKGAPGFSGREEQRLSGKQSSALATHLQVSRMAVIHVLLLS